MWLKMSEHVISKQLVEENYIDNMLGVVCQQPVETNLDMAETASAEIIDENLYQLISVSGLKFAIQLLEISQVVDQIDINTENSMLIHQGEPLSIIDIEQLIKPSDKSTESKHYVLITHRRMTIACQQLMDIQTIEKQTVCWRTENSQRQWLAGTIKQQGIAILDLNALQKMRSSE